MVFFLTFPSANSELNFGYFVPPQLPPVGTLTLRAAPLHGAVTATLVQLAAAAGTGHGEGNPCRGDGIDERCLPCPCKGTNHGGEGGNTSRSPAGDGKPDTLCSLLPSPLNAGVAHKPP